MKQSILFTFIAFLSLQIAVQAQGINFFHGSWDEALQEAKEQSKPIFVDAYAVWCGPCKRMAATTFKDAKVGEFYNANFINLKIDMERGQGPDFRRKYPVSAFPTLYYIDGDGEVLHMTKGAKGVEDFIKLGQLALRKEDKSGAFIRKYQDGDRSPEAVYAYLNALNQRNESDLKAANDYLAEQSDLSSEINRKIIFEAATEADSRVFEMLMRDREAIAELVSAEEVDKRIEKACRRTVEKAIEFESDMLLEESKAKMADLLPERAKDFNLQSEMAYSLAMRDAEEYMEAAKTYCKANTDLTEVKVTVEQLRKHFGHETQSGKLARQLAEDAAKKNNTTEAYLFFATILKESGDLQTAKKAAQKAAKLATDTSEKLAAEKFLQDHDL